nr:hypothetical protein [Tanacetum cinerariifolium]
VFKTFSNTGKYLKIKKAFAPATLLSLLERH